MGKALATATATKGLEELMKPTTTQDLSNMILYIIVQIMVVLRNTIKPVAGVGMLIGIVILIIGVVTKSEKIKKTGLSTMAGICGVIVLYFLSPHIIGWIYDIMNQATTNTK